MVKADEERRDERAERIHVEVVQGARGDDPPERRDRHHSACTATRAVGAAHTLCSSAMPRGGSWMKSAAIAAQSRPGAAATKSAARQPHCCAT